MSPIKKKIIITIVILLPLLIITYTICKKFKNRLNKKEAYIQKEISIIKKNMEAKNEKKIFLLFKNCSKNLNSYFQFIFNSPIKNYIKKDNFLNHILEQSKKNKKIIFMKYISSIDPLTVLSPMDLFLNNDEYFHKNIFTIIKATYKLCGKCKVPLELLQEEYLPNILNVESIIDIKYKKYEKDYLEIETCNCTSKKIEKSIYIINRFLIIHFQIPSEEIYYTITQLNLKLRTYIREIGNSYKTYSVCGNISVEYNDKYNEGEKFDDKYNIHLALYEI